MKHERRLSRRLSFCLLLLVASAITVAAQGPKAQKRFLGGPLVLEDQGSFFIGGVEKVTDYTTLPPAPGTPGVAPNAPIQPGPPAATRAPHQITIGQMYVSFQIPARKGGTGWPVIMVHGSSHTAACLEATPDGREGWAPYYVRKGNAVYLVDQAGRGRSGFDESVIHEGEVKITQGDVARGMELMPRIGRITDDGSWTNWFGHLVPANSTILTGTLIRHGDPGDPNPNPKPMPHNHPQFPTETQDTSLVAREGAIGPTPGGPSGYFSLEYYKQLVPNGEATLPGSKCATCDPADIQPANTWTPMNLALLVEKLGGAIVVTHSQSGIMGHHMTRILKERGHLNLLKGLVTIEGGCSLPNSGLTAADFDKIPYLALKGDYTVTSPQCQETVNAINTRRAAKLGTAKAEYMKLDEMGILGVTHMMMLGTNNLQIADIMMAWANKNIPAAPKAPLVTRAQTSEKGGTR
jgi:hypothetical protein